jgi:hypothetical protein
MTLTAKLYTGTLYQWIIRDKSPFYKKVVRLQFVKHSL